MCESAQPGQEAGVSTSLATQDQGVFSLHFSSLQRNSLAGPGTQYCQAKAIGSILSPVADAVHPGVAYPLPDGRLFALQRKEEDGSSSSQPPRGFGPVESEVPARDNLGTLESDGFQFELNSLFCRVVSQPGWSIAARKTGRSEEEKPTVSSGNNSILQFLGAGRQARLTFAPDNQTPLSTKAGQPLFDLALRGNRDRQAQALVAGIEGCER